MSSTIQFGGSALQILSRSTKSLKLLNSVGINVVMVPLQGTGQVAGY